MSDLAQMSVGGSYLSIFSGGGSFASFALLDSPLPLTKSKGELLCTWLGEGLGQAVVCVVKQTATTCLHASRAGSDQARLVCRASGQAAGLLGRQLAKTPGTLNTLSISRHPFQAPVSVCP